MPDEPGAEPTIMERPGFHLLYLPFYFTPWLFQTPGTSDIIAAVIALIIFSPLYFRAFGGTKPGYIFYAIAIEGIALAAGPFNGMEGTFHIYAASIAGFQSSTRRAVISIIALSVVYTLFAHIVIEAPLVRTGLVLFMSGIVGATCIASLQSITAQDARERSLMLDRQLAAVEERERIAGDLHDILGHTLTMVAVKADLAEKLFDVDTAKARQELHDIKEAARGALGEVRDTVQGMNSVTLAGEITRARESLGAIGISFEVSGAIPDLPRLASKAVGLAIREAVTNTVRHSEATSAHLEFTEMGGTFSLRISDNGRGLTSGETFEPGEGLQGLTRRIAALGGKALIDMTNGTRIDVSLPIHDQGSA